METLQAALGGGLPVVACLVTLAIGMAIGMAIGLAIGRQRMARRHQTLTDALTTERVASATLRGRIGQLEAERDRARHDADSAASLAALVTPLQDTLEGLRRMTIDAHDRRTLAETALTTQIENVQARYASLEQATDQLVAALSRGQTRGQWGEMQLEQLLHHSGLIEGVHFVRQRTSPDGARRPDVVVHLPAHREIAVDAKFPFDAYWTALGTTDPAARERGMRQHAADLSARVRELASKGYHRDPDSQDIVVLFLPLESLLSAALEVDGALLGHAFRQRVVLATPTTLLALLRTIGFAYDRALLAQNTEEVRRVGSEMLHRLGTLVEHLDGMRRGLAAAVSGYNAFVGSFERQALSQARRMRELGVDGDRPLDAPDDLALDLRPVRPA